MEVQDRISDWEANWMRNDQKIVMFLSADKGCWGSHTVFSLGIWVTSARRLWVHVSLKPPQQRCHSHISHQSLPNHLLQLGMWSKPPPAPHQPLTHWHTHEYRDAHTRTHRGLSNFNRAHIVVTFCCVQAGSNFTLPSNTSRHTAEVRGPCNEAV